MASFVQINPPCNLCKTDPLSASELSGKVEDALAGRSPLFSSLLHRLYKMARSGFSLCKKEKWIMLAIVFAQFAPGGDELIEGFVQNSGWERCLVVAGFKPVLSKHGLVLVLAFQDSRSGRDKESGKASKRIIFTGKLSF